MNKIDNFDLFYEGIKTKDLSSIPGKEPGESDYISDVTRRAKTRLGIEGEREGDFGGISRAGSTLMSELSNSQRLSRGHEKELENLATEIIKMQFGPLLDYYKIKLDIQFSSGPQIRRFIDDRYSKRRGDEPTGKQTPVVRARGADFSMLIHEAVKGIWRVLSMRSVPADKEIAKAIESQFGLMDEPDDWKYGPEIAADLRDFVNQNPKTDKFQNVREEVWLYMCDEKKIPTDQFLNFMKGILSKTQEARIKMDRIIDEIVDKLEKREKYLRDLEKYNLEMKEYERKMEEYGRKMSEYKKKTGSQQKEKPELKTTKSPEETKDYSKMTQRELNTELSSALDAKDFEKAKEISQYLK